MQLNERIVPTPSRGNKYNYHKDNMFKRIYMKIIFKIHGLDVKPRGQIEYNSKKMETKSNAIYLLRHGETEATQNREFMSDTSNNAHICQKGIKDILELHGEIKQYNFDEVIICSNIPRVLETANIFKLIHPNLKYKYKKNFKGIDNSGWEGKTPKTLEGIDLNDFEEREANHNIFAKSAKGGSWGLVLLNTIRLINYLNKNCVNKRVLLIGQGSILKAIAILTHMTLSPWEEYDTQKLYNFDEKQIQSNYAKINCLYDYAIMSKFSSLN